MPKAKIKLPTTLTESVWFSEIDTLLKDYPNINMDKFNSALMGNTCIMVDGEIVIYHCDIEKALRCGIENRNLRSWEWD